VTAATFDAHVLASGFVRPHGPPGQLLRLWRAGTFTLIVSVPLIVETERTLEKRYFVLAAAVSANSDYLVTGNRKLQALGMYEGVRILSPRQFLDVLDARDA
jgi:predicted nucleic acid-binding protein